MAERYEWIKENGYSIDVRDRANVVLLAGTNYVGRFSSMDAAVTHAELEIEGYDGRA